jgi:hypothetical protein
MSDLILRKLESASCYLLPGRIPPHGSEFTALYNQAFFYWQNFWADLFEGNGCPEALAVDDFMRQDMICVLTVKNEIIGTLFISLNNLDNMAFFQHSYSKKNFTSEYFQKIKAYGVSSIVALEYLTIDPKWRKRVIGLSTAHIIMGIGFAVFKALHIDAVICPARKDVKAADIVSSFGGEVIIPDILLHNTPCDFMLVRRKLLQPSADPQLARLTEALWLHRIDFTGYTTEGTDYPLIKKTA